MLALLVGVAVIVPQIQHRLAPDGSNHASATTTTPPPAERLDVPGFDPAPESLTLDLPDDDGSEPVTVSFDLPENAVRSGGAIGLSFDATELANPQWGSADSNLTLTLGELDAPVLRFGGNGVDRRMWWTSSEEDAPDWAEATVTPESLRAVERTAETIDAKVTLTLDLGHDDPARAADMASYAQDIFGDRLLAVSIGNEPNGYFHENQPQLAVRDSDWDPEAYQDSLRDYAEAVEQTAPELPIAGPGAYDAPWWRAFAEAGISDEAALTMHWYPLWDCSGPQGSIANPTVEDLTSPALRQQAKIIIGMGKDVADEHDLPLWMEETGPTSCPGTNETSRTHAQALWTVDYAFSAMESGVSRLAFHSTLQSCSGGAPMSSICATGSLDSPGLIVEGRSSYLALMQLAQMPEGQVLSPSTSGDGQISVHGVLTDDGALSIAIVDMRDPTEDSSTRTVQVSAPGGLPEGAPRAWALSTGSKLGAASLSAEESSLAAPAPIAGDLAAASLAPAEPATIPSSPGEVALLRFDQVTTTSDGT
ncbi:hypothetical protein C1N80_04870 [Brachybacterium sp. SGAir0954]|nr:hypothetical protein C1N80_04870 [Brachybacterium sp. SGAir0954]